MSDARDQASDERLDDLDEQTERTRKKAQDAGIIEDPDEPKFHETGELSDIDDQTIAPG